jgi:Tfp pilus assembly protein PilN
MKKIPDINFATNPIQRQTQLGYVWGILGLVLLVQILYNFWMYNEHQQELRTQLEVVQRQAAQTSKLAKSPPLTAQQSDALASLQQMISRLTVPWEDMFSGIEAAYVKQVTLESLQPRAEQGEVMLIFSGPSFKSLSDFIAALAAQPEFKDVHLQSEIFSEKNGLGWQANVTMKWVAKK